MKLFKGVMTALVTPFKGGQVDEQALRKLVNWQINEGIHGLVPCGTTGESATLSTEEKKEVINIVLDQVKKRVPVIAGTGTNNTAESVKLTQWAKEAGADGALAVSPYYNKPSQEGLYQHYAALAEVGLPLVLYNVPGRTAVSMSVSTIKRLSERAHIVAVKEATASMGFATELKIACNQDFTLISGDDFTFLPFLSVGGDGVISVVSNITPKLMVELYNDFNEKRLDAAHTKHLKLYPLIESLFLESNPVPVKTALAMMNKISEEVRLPLSPLTNENKKTLQQQLKQSGLV